MVVDADWRPKLTGTSRFQVEITNPGDTPLYPVCRITVVATTPKRHRTVAWAGTRAIQPGATESFEFELAKTPVDPDPTVLRRPGIVAVSGSVCTGAASLPVGASGDAPARLTTGLPTSTATPPIDSRSTVTIKVPVTNNGPGPVTASCRAQVAGTSNTKPPIAAGDPLSIYVFHSTTEIGAGSTATLTFTATNAPVRVISSLLYHWLVGVRCWVN